jgi:hypothetical protein
MSSRLHFVLLVSTTALLLVPVSQSQQASSSAVGNSPTSQQGRKPSVAADRRLDAGLLDAGSVSQGVYRNPTFGFTCKIPPGWVLRTAEMNIRDGEDANAAEGKTRKEVDKPGRVLLAVFSRPPDAEGEDVNSSILIAAENAAAYPGLKDAAQYFGPVSEIARAQGFAVINEPYEFPLDTKTVVRSDFQKNVGTRVMRQSTLAILSHGYAVSFTFIGGTEDEVEELIEGLSFGVIGKAVKR